MNKPIHGFGRSGSLGSPLNEFPLGATDWPADLSRREFLQTLGASLALAGLTACGRPQTDKIVPYVIPPEQTPSPDVSWYASAMPWEGFARGILVKAVRGRPIKIEGNPDHPESLGATDAITQAAILSLYDPDRSTAPSKSGQVAAWQQFESEWIGRLPGLQSGRGAGLAILTEPTTSPTQLRLLHTLLDAWPSAGWFQHTPLPRFDRDGIQADFDFAAADVVLSLGADSFYHHPSALRYARAFASRRKIENGRVHLNRFFASEPTLSLTGAQADQRLPVSPDRLGMILNALAQAIDGKLPGRELSAAENRWIIECARELRDPAKIGICTVGEEMAAGAHEWAGEFNRRFGRSAARRLPAVRSDGDPRSRGDLADLVRSIESGELSTLLVFGSNPVYTAPAGLDVASAFRQVGFTVHLGEHADETAACCQWHLPEAHFLESWSDLRGYPGVATLQQPLIEPLHPSRSVGEVLNFVQTGLHVNSYDLVRETWRAGVSGDFEERWHGWLNKGVIDEPAESLSATPVRRDSHVFPVLNAEKTGSSVSVLFRPDSNVLDGRYANNGWLQELPRPFTALVWENAALISPSLAEKLKIKNRDVIECAHAGKILEAPVWILPGQAADCVTLPLGYGRSRGGTTAQDRGFRAYALRPANDSWQLNDVTIRVTGRRVSLVTTQEHFSLEGRNLIPVVAEKDLPSRNPEKNPAASLFPSWPREGHAWGMAIDLSTCYGCNACVVACQAENNIPIVGRDQVARGREMHWIRVDRYFSGDADNPRVLHQPVLCMHCENAPCEVVCPVGATVHSSEGLNDMVYNRCVGTRYCSNNCPYKVRRFNFLDYRAPKGSPVYLQSNPDVTVRERGVMEKCSYCVQRINAGRIAAEKENRRLRDGEVRTACQQACPVEAIAFGDLNDPQSRVVQRKAENTSYLLLAELNTRPRTSYLAKIVPDKISRAEETGS